MGDRAYARQGSARGVTIAGAVASSRLLVLGVGIAGATIASRVAGWASVDTHRVTTSFGAVGNDLAAASVRWDALAYTGIAAHGYTTKISTAFFPFYPLTIKAIGWITGSYTVAGILISSVSFAVALVLLHRLTTLELDRRAADAAVLLLAFAPVSLFFTAIYTESLFLALSVGAIYAARRGRPAVAGVLAALATVTRVTGILLVVPLALLHIRDSRRPKPRLAWLLLPPAALVAFLGYLSTQGYGWFAPLHGEVARKFVGPFTTIGDAARAGWNGLSSVASGLKPYAPSLQGPFAPGFDSLLLLVVLVLAIAALIVTFRRLPLAYGGYSLLALLVSIFSETWFQPLAGVDRYVLTIFPLWMAAGSWIAERNATRTAVLISAPLCAFYTYQFATWAFIA